MALTDFIDEPTLQLINELQSSIPSSRLRPILSHLNADTSWLVSIPYPTNSSCLNVRSKAYFHILLDPWFAGSQSDVAAVFSQQWHSTPSAVQTAEDLEDRVLRIEMDVLGEKASDHTMNGDPEESLVDLIVISHEFTDHMHKETLLSLSASILVIASSKAAGIIESWNHFSSVAELPRFAGDWKEQSHPKLPTWISVSRVAYPGKDVLYYHAAVLICFQSASGSSGADAEAIIYTPHGVSPQNVQPVADAEPRIQTLALLHGLQDIKLPAGAQLNLGAHNGLKIQRLLGCKYWVGTHDEVKRGGGLVSWFLNRKMISLKEAVEEEKIAKGEDMQGSELSGLSDVRFEEVDNGGSLVLE